MSGIAGMVYRRRPDSRAIGSEEVGSRSHNTRFWWWGVDRRRRWIRLLSQHRIRGSAKDLFQPRAYAIVADARIDGRDDLLSHFDPERRNALGHSGNAELIFSCYESWGAAFLDHVIGDFSFAIWDGTQRRLLCARDQFGVKPLFYVAAGFSVLEYNRLPGRLPGDWERLDHLAIADFLLFGRTGPRYNGVL